MAFERSRPEDVEQTDAAPDSIKGAEPDGWSRSAEERDRDHAEERRGVREHLAEDPRTRYGRPSTEQGDRAPRSVPDQAKESPDDAEEISEADRRVAELRIETHGPQRHLDVSNDQLRDRLGTPEVGPDGKPVLKPNGEVRSRDHIDPMTGTTVDGVHGRPHRSGDAATAFSNPEDYVAAEAFMRTKAIADRDPRPEATIEEVLGKDAEQRMRGYRHDRDVAGHYTEVDFTGGTIAAFYKLNAAGELQHGITLFPAPALEQES